MKRVTDLPPDKEILFSQADRLFSAFVDRYRYSAIGALVKGIVHNVNGSLQILSMQMEMLQGMMAKDGERINPSIPVKVEKCVGELDKVKTMIEVLLQKGDHDDQDTPQVIHLNDLLEEKLSLLHHHLFFKHHIKVKKAFCSKLSLLKGNYIDFSQGLFNLIQNAIEAMEASPKKELTLVTENNGHSIRFMVKDTGCGISEEVRNNLFRPFFTTKGGKNYGLGLFISRELLTPYGAIFDFTSQKGETTFSINFPLKSGHSASFKKI